MDYQARRQAQAQDTRRAILDAAVRLSREKGFDKVTIRALCAAAGVTTGAFYHHFTSKEDLLEQGFSSLDVYLEEAMAPYDGHPALSRLQALLRSYAQFMEEQGWETIGLYYCRRMSRPESSSMSPQRFTLRTMLGCLHELAQEGTLTPAFTSEWIADFFFRHFRGVVVDWVLHQGSYPLWNKLVQDYQVFDRAFRA